MHNCNKIDEGAGFPEMMLDYNVIKAGTDRVDQLCPNYSVHRKGQSAGHWSTSTTASILRVSKHENLSIKILLREK